MWYRMVAGGMLCLVGMGIREVLGMKDGRVMGFVDGT